MKRFGAFSVPFFPIRSFLKSGEQRFWGFVFHVGDLELQEKRRRCKVFGVVFFFFSLCMQTLERGRVGRLAEDWNRRNSERSRVERGKRPRSNLMKTKGAGGGGETGQTRPCEEVGTRKGDGLGRPRAWGGRSHHCPRGFPPGKTL